MPEALQAQYADHMQLLAGAGRAAAAGHPVSSSLHQQPHHLADMQQIRHKIEQHCHLRALHWALPLKAWQIFSV